MGQQGMGDIGDHWCRLVAEGHLFLSDLMRVAHLMGSMVFTGASCAGLGLTIKIILSIV